MADENTNDETSDETTAEEPETTDAPDGVADVENVSEEAAPEVPEAEATESEASAEPEPEPAEEPAEGPPADETDEPVAEAAETADEPTEDAEPAEEPAEGDGEATAEAAAPTKKKRKRLPRSLRRRRTKPTRERPAERRAITRLPKPEHERGRRQERQGTVVSAAADKTIVVRVDVVKVHPMYKKVVKRSTKLHAHDESNQAKVGDIVLLVEARPLSKLKRWRLQKVVEAAK